MQGTYSCDAKKLFIPCHPFAHCPFLVLVWRCTATVTATAVSGAWMSQSQKALAPPTSKFAKPAWVAHTNNVLLVCCSQLPSSPHMLMLCGPRSPFTAWLLMFFEEQNVGILDNTAQSCRLISCCAVLYEKQAVAHRRNAVSANRRKQLQPT